MKAAVFRAYGAPDVIEIADVAVPETGDGDVLVKVAATSFNPVDALIRSGGLQALLTLPLPYAIGSDIAGTVEKVGSSVTDFKAGDRVYAYGERPRTGAGAEFVACSASKVAFAPKTISLGDAAALPLVACTAWQALFVHGQVGSGSRVVILGAAGGVGTMAVQLAKAKGAYVIAVSSAKHGDQLTALGADETIDYKTTSLEDALGEKVDMILNLSPLDPADLDKLLPLLTPGGTLVSAAKPADAAAAEALGVKAIRMASQPSAEQLTELAGLIDAGQVRPVVTERVPLEQLADVHRKVGQTSGKVVIVVDEKLAAA